MRKITGKLIRKTGNILPVLLFALLLVNTTRAADLEDHPGYVNFEGLTLFTPDQSTAQVNLKPALLSVLAGIVRHDEPQIADLLSQLLSVNVNVFDTPDRDREDILEVISVTADELDARGWDRVARVREDREYVDVYFKLSGDGSLIEGITVMVSEPWNTVFVNVVGDIRPEDIGALAQHFNIDHLDEVDWENQ